MRVLSVVHDRSERTGCHPAGCLYHNLERVRLPSVLYICWISILTESNLRYTDNYVTDSEFSSLPPRLQDALRRTATNNQNNSAGWGGYYTPAQVPNRYKRIGTYKPVLTPEFKHSQIRLLDWLRDKVYFDGLLRNDHYAVNRLGYKAPNIFVMQIAS